MTRFERGDAQSACSRMAAISFAGAAFSDDKFEPGISIMG